MTYDEMVELIKSGKPFAFSRWGDGEWITIRGGRDGEGHGGNADGNFYYLDLGKRLKQIVSQKQDYIMGAQSSASLPSDRDKYDQDWINADIFHKASIHGKLDKLFNALDGRHVVYVGNESLKKLPFINEFVEIPFKNVWKQYDKTLTRILARTSGQFKVFCFSGGMATNVFIHDLWNEDPWHSYIDVGSVFDPYVGRITRKYHENLNIKSF